MKEWGSPHATRHLMQAAKFVQVLMNIGQASHQVSSACRRMRVLV